jgi:cytochrome c551/c552
LKAITLFMLSQTGETAPGYYTSMKVIPSAGVGQRLFEQKGCVGCHSIAGRLSAIDPGTSAAITPAINPTASPSIDPATTTTAPAVDPATSAPVPSAIDPAGLGLGQNCQPCAPKYNCCDRGARPLAHAL